MVSQGRSSHRRGDESQYFFLKSTFWIIKNSFLLVKMVFLHSGGKMMSMEVKKCFFLNPHFAQSEIHFWGSKISTLIKSLRTRSIYRYSSKYIEKYSPKLYFDIFLVFTMFSNIVYSVRHLWMAPS